MGLFGKLLEKLGHPESRNSKLDGQLHSLELELPENPTLVLIDKADLMLKRLRGDEQEILFSLWRPFDQPASFVLTAETKLKCSDITWGLTRPVKPMGVADSINLLRLLCWNEGFTEGLDPAVEQRIVEQSKGYPGALHEAARLLGNEVSPDDVVAALAKKTSPDALRVAAGPSQNTPADLLAAALTMVPSRRWSVIRAITAELVPDFAAAQEALLLRFSQLGRKDSSRAGDLLPDNLTSRAKELLAQSGPEHEALYRGLRAWIVDVVKQNQEWQKDTSQYDSLKASIGDLRSAVTTLIDEKLDGVPDADEARAWIKVAEMVHDFGSWDMAAGLMDMLLERMPNLAERLEVQLLMARHLSYRGNSEEALALLKTIETAAGDLLPQIVVQARLRRGQSRRFSHPDQAKADLLNAMERGSLHDFLVATGFLVDVFMNQPEGDRGERLLETALGIHHLLGYPAERIRAHHLRLKGEIRLIAGNYDGARTYFEQALELGQKWADDQRLLGWCQLGLALCDASRKAAESAANTFRQLGLDRDQKRAERLVAYLDMFAQKPAPCIFILGGPAAGKTTLRDPLAEWLIREGIPASRVGIEEAQRDCFQTEGFPSRGRGYEYTVSGSLILNDRVAQIPLAYNRLRAMVRQQRNLERRAVIVEFTHPQLQWAFDELGTDLLARAIVFYLKAPYEVRLARNQKRLNQPSHVPDDVVRDFDGTMDEAVGTIVRESGAVVQEIDATAEPGRVLAEARKLLEESGLYWSPAGGVPAASTGCQ
jgi:hypothetical protein